jgi:hypothetical protein
MFNTTKLNKAISDSKSLRRATLMQKAPYYTTMAGALAAGINAAGINRGRATLAALPRFGSFSSTTARVGRRCRSCHSAWHRPG